MYVQIGRIDRIVQVTNIRLPEGETSSYSLQLGTRTVMFGRLL